MQNKILFQDLPKDVQEAVSFILLHRKKILRNVPLGIFSQTFNVTAHRVAFQVQEWWLFRQLSESQNPQIKNMLQQFPFIIIDRKGNILGKKQNPKIGFFTFGRKRIPTNIEPAFPNRKRKKRLNKK